MNSAPITKVRRRLCYFHAMSSAAGAPDVPSTATDDLRYPVGRFVRAASYSLEDRDHAIELISDLPTVLLNAVGGLSGSQLDTPYRPQGWTVRQVIHHLADSHTQAFSRIRFALTEDQPVIKPYDEKAWAELSDSLAAPAEWSLELLEALHGRWVMLLQRLTPRQWKRTFLHPENGSTTIEAATQMYAWHGRHHTAHITHLRAARGW